MPSVAIYPPLFAAAFVLHEYTISSVPLETALRPFIVAIAVALALQVLITGLARSVDRGAFIALNLLLVLIGLPELAVVLSGGFVIAAVAASRRDGRLENLPWSTLTQSLNAVGGITLLLVLVNAGSAGALAFAHRDLAGPTGKATAGAPDIYLIMLDGYPRSDTQLNEFHLDNRPFLAEMASMGFDVASQSHSNYNTTILTMASVLSGSQIPPQVPDPPASVPAQYRVLSGLINGAAGLRPFRQAGYEVVSLPNAYTDAALFSADRVIDGGHLTYFEMHLLSAGILRPFLGSPLMDNYRSGVTDAFDRLPDLARERGGPPKIVLAHILVPHMPIAFTRTGGPAQPLPCYPMQCPMFVFGDEYGDALIEPMREQIEWVNSEVARTVREIQSASPNPPVVVVFSDHGMRNDPADLDEMFRSFLMAATPGRSGLFPEDASPVNILARLASAYVGSPATFSSEESYWIDTRRPDGDVLTTVEPWPAK